MSKHHDSHTALWLTELGWGSAHRTRRWPLNKGLRDRSGCCRSRSELVLNRRSSWHIERLFWFDWRDPPRGTGDYCSFCASAGLLATTTSRSPPTAPSGTSPVRADPEPARLAHEAPSSFLLYDFRGMRGAWRQQGGDRLSDRRSHRRDGASLLGASAASAARSEFYGIVQAGRSTTRTSRGCRRPGCGRTASCSSGAGSSRPRARSSGVDRQLHRRARLARDPAVPSSGERRAGSAGALRSPRSAAPPSKRLAGLPDGRWWRATAPAAATGGPPTTSSSGPNATPLPIQSWQIWNEPNLKKFFAPGQPVTGQVRPPAPDLPRRDQEQGPEGPDRAGRDAGPRRLEGLGLPQEHLRGARDQELLRRHRAAPLCPRSGRGAQRDPEVPHGRWRATATPRRRSGSPSSPGDRRLRTASGSTRGSRARRSC